MVGGAFREAQRNDQKSDEISQSFRGKDDSQMVFTRLNIQEKNLVSQNNESKKSLWHSKEEDLERIIKAEKYMMKN
jgi:hypothetical protein